MLAAEAGDLKLVTTLLEFDARVEDRDKDGNNALVYANKKRKVGVIVEFYSMSLTDISSIMFYQFRL